MDYKREFIKNWWSNNNYFTASNVLDNYLDSISDEVFWDVDKFSFEIYKKEIRKLQKRYKVSSLSYEDEQHLIKLKCEGDEVAFMKLFYSQLKYVIHVARKYQNLGLPLNDLVSEGNIGLMEAIKKVQPRGFRIATYAVWHIKANIQNAINKFGSQIYYPSTILLHIWKLQAEITTYKLINGQIPSSEELSASCNLSIDTVEQSLKYTNTEISMFRLYRHFRDYDIIDDFLNSFLIPQYNFSFLTPDDELYNESLSNTIDRTLRKLNKIEREILKMYYGIGCTEMSLTEIAYKFDVTRERIRQIKEKAIRKLKGHRSKELRLYLG